MQPSNSSVVNLIYRRAQNHNAETNICGFLKMLTLYWFSIFKRKIYRGLDTWKNVWIYIKCLSPELSLGKHPLRGYLKMLECVPFFSVAPPKPQPPFKCWKVPFAPVSLPCAGFWAALAWEAWCPSPPCASP